MTVSKRALADGRVVWDVKAYLGIHPKTKKKIQKTERNFPTKMDAVLREAELRVEFSKYRENGTRPDVTVGEHLERWLPRHAREVEESTAAVYRQIADLDILPVFGDTLLQDMRPADIQYWIDHLMSPESGRGRNGQGLAPKTMDVILAVLSGVLQDAFDLEILNRNAAKRVKVPRKKRARLLVHPDVALEVLSELEGTQWYDIAHTAYHTGMRRSEVAGLIWSRVDFHHRLIEVVEARKEPRGRSEVVIGPPKNDSKRTIAMTAGTHDLLSAHLELQQALFEEMGREWTSDTFVFLDEVGEPMKLHSITRKTKDAALRAGHNEFTFHAFRRGFATALAMQNVNPKAAQQCLGHKNIQTTLEFYTDATPEMIRQAADAFEALFA